ncbi:hypothetical protein ADJ76_01250 [Schaalia meyeri]|uniref:hypothetical protein n=1 Tax=Schaalia meyeri TaxID=52773 RepID=UPI0006836BC4|nr:hypothetical protein [Schaalia meyeri]AKU64571.1 hypothetical protein ADJ76_01250 [Schaalia meyeri]
MRLARVLCSAAAALALTAFGGVALADEPTPIRLVEVYEITPGVNATHEVTLSTDHPLIGEQCQSMGTAAKATSSVLVDVDGVAGCRFTWVLEDAGAEVVSIEDGGIFRFHSVSARLLEGYSSPEATATIARVTLVAHASQVEEASAGGSVSSHAGSTKTDASTVTWENVTEDVSAAGTVDATGASTPSATPSPSLAASATTNRGEHESSWRLLAPIIGLTAAVLGLAIAGAAVRFVTGVRRRAADARFDRDASERAAQRRVFAGDAATPRGLSRSARTPETPAPDQGGADVQDSERFSPPGRP